MLCCVTGRVSIGDNSILGDPRWGGLFGIEAQFIAVDDVKVGLGKYHCLYGPLAVKIAVRQPSHRGTVYHVVQFPSVDG
jgi:hypothetical protein